MFDHVRAAGFAMRSVPYEQWHRALVEAVDRGEENALNLGFIASKEARTITREDVVKVLKLVPDTERAVVWDSITLRASENRSEQMIELVKRLDQQVVYSPPPSPKPALLRRVIRKVKSLG